MIAAKPSKTALKLLVSQSTIDLAVRPTGILFSVSQFNEISPAAHSSRKIKRPTLIPTPVVEI